LRKVVPSVMPSGWPIALLADAASMRTGTMMSECA
jgi:hypothetical protein